MPAQGRLELDLETTSGRTAFSKQDSAIVSRSFSYRTRAAALHARAVVLRVATETGWHVNFHPRYTTDPFRGSKRLTPGEAELTVGEWRKEGRYHVSIRLEPAGG